jgi:HK97 family phage portal protein
MTLLQRAYDSFFSAKANTERPPMSIGSGLNINGVGIGAPTSNQLVQMQTLSSTSWLFAVVDRIASSTAAVQWDLVRKMPDGQSRIVEKHPIIDLWNSVNPFYTRHEFIETSIQHFELTGEIWWLIVRNRGGKPVELWNIRPDRIRPVPHPSEFVAGYIYSVGQHQIPLERKDVIFIRRPSPIDPYRGIGTVQSMMVDVGAEQMAAQWTRNFFTNGALPSGILQFDEGMSDQDFERLVSRWGQQHQGVANSHRVAVLERGKWVDRKFSARDMQLEQFRKLNRDIIFGAYGIPSSVMGVTESVNRANAEAGDVLFSTHLLTPLLERIKQAVNERLVHVVDKSLTLQYSDPVPENRELNSRIAQESYKNGLITRNEGRALLGLADADEGGEEYAATGGGGLLGLEVNDLVTKAASDIRDESVNREEDQMEIAWSRRLRRERDSLIEYLEGLN